MKKNKGFTLIELIIVLALLTGVLAFFWKILGSSSKDAYTINDKIEVQNSVTSLMNMIQQDTQEAKIVLVSDTKYGIFRTVASSDKIYEDKIYEFGDTNNKKTYVFDSASRTLTRTIEKKVNNTVNKESAVYNDIVGFLLEAVDKPNYGAKVSIIGSKKNYIGNSLTAETGIIETSAVQVGQYIKYSGGDYTGKWVVLRNNGGTIEIISKESVKNLTLGSKTDTEKAKSDYANAVQILNNECSAYVNSTYATSGRSVGATSSSIGQINTSVNPLTFAAARTQKPPYHDTCYTADKGVISGNTNLKHTSGEVWLASRFLTPYTSEPDRSNFGSSFGLWYLLNNGTGADYLFDAHPDTTIKSYSWTKGVRPVITLKSGIKITGGSGTSGSPYEIAIGDSGNNGENSADVDKSRYSLDSTFYTRNTTR